MADKYLAMYDIRGIQNYIFRTNKVKDAIGASYIVENIIDNALEYALQELKQDQITISKKWFDENGPIPFVTSDIDIQVLFVGGGNGLILYSSETLCKKMNVLMSQYVMENTYSLQLAIAVIKKSDNYAEDYKNINNEMVQIKANMELSRPIGALPIMQIDINTGNPIRRNECRDGGTQVDHETLIKVQNEKKVREDIKTAERTFDEYIMQKSKDSTIAVVHIDGNNMGLRIRDLIKNKETYEEAVTQMRIISYSINHSYKSTFDEMARKFNKSELDGKKYSVLKILTAGDDITYVVRAKAALASVEYFCNEISKKTMNGLDTPEALEEYGFTVCAGIAFIHSHFPFSIAYEVAEECCESAKDVAKQDENKLGSKVGNWVDFQICKNVQTRDLSATREGEYVTSFGEKLLARPYAISFFSDAVSELCRYETFKANMAYFSDDKKIPRSHAKSIRNTYTEGEGEMKRFAHFLHSRNIKMPDGTVEMYAKESGVKIAKWYDALELLDEYVALETILKEDAANE